MALDGKLLARAKDKLDKRRRENELEYARRTEEVYAAAPRVREIDGLMRSTVMDAIGFALSGGADPVSAVEEVADLNLDLQRERDAALVSAGYPCDYIDLKYICPVCRDTGYDGRRLCSCLLDLYREEQQSDLASLLRLGTESFDGFDLTLYDSRPDPATGISPRNAMELVYNTCVQYAVKFGVSSPNLFFTGSTGLGKTFLSGCIARDVFSRGFSVVYDTVSSILTKFEDEKFRRGDADTLRRETERCLTCDLLIIDDLGTELGGGFSASTLYTIINSRLLTKNTKTVISSNLSIDELKKRYPQQIVSRLLGEYQIIPFFGRDIRLMKNGRI